ncbi:MarR family winged helix-turn-helix transcriptional regulator [Embleya scabrispora]|uniref:MarR family winged helix-turn-helix transcriptional regulator n=1 Tax=Embleya scabrispora TaxID=159449 RepID=UPI00036E44C3|nr:MarR family transcriptional regulator [Embleya scabrispora]MYS85036.1 MarR family transcriptional regulator [Streptomyces sp. SID5474]
MKTEEPLIESWRNLLSQYSLVAHELDRALQAEHCLTMSDYEVLDRLIAADGCKARIHDLVGDLHLSQSASSRAVARLEKCGLVERAMCDTDRRGVFVTATDRGRALHLEARRTQLAVLQKHLAG